jgi:nitrate/nitrite transport system substrate-binding protein
LPPAPRRPVAAFSAEPAHWRRRPRRARFSPPALSRKARDRRSRARKLGYIALTDAAPLIIAKEKGLFAKHGLPDMDIAKQASWGATRDNMALGTKANGIDGGHILRPKTHLYATGKVMQNGQPLPMYTLLNLNEDCQAFSVSNDYKGLGVVTPRR